MPGVSPYGSEMEGHFSSPTHSAYSHSHSPDKRLLTTPLSLASALLTPPHSHGIFTPQSHSQARAPLWAMQVGGGVGYCPSSAWLHPTSCRCIPHSASPLAGGGRVSGHVCGLTRAAGCAAARHGCALGGMPAAAGAARPLLCLSHGSSVVHRRRRPRGLQRCPARQARARGRHARGWRLGPS
jgi:hypothetical protein